MAEDQKDLLNSVKRFGLNCELSNEECEWTGQFNLVKPDALQTLKLMTQNPMEEAEPFFVTRHTSVR